MNISTLRILLLMAQLCLKALSDIPVAQKKMVAEENRLDKAEEVLGDHLTGGVVQGWRQVQRKLGILVQGETEAAGSHFIVSAVVHTGWSFGGAGPEGPSTDHDKLLARLEVELWESQHLVRLQQQLLQVLYLRLQST